MTKPLTLVTNHEMLNSAFDEMLYDPRPGFQVDGNEVSLGETIRFLHRRMREHDPDFFLKRGFDMVTTRIEDQGLHIDDELLEASDNDLGLGVSLQENIWGNGKVSLRLGRPGLVSQKPSASRLLDYRGERYSGELTPNRLTIMSQGIYRPDGLAIGPAFHDYRTEKGGQRYFRRWTDARVKTNN